MERLTDILSNETEAQFLARAKKFYSKFAPKEQLTIAQRKVIRETLASYLMRGAASGFAYLFTFNNKKQIVKCIYISCSTGEIIRDTVTAKCNERDVFDVYTGMMICVWRIQGIPLPPFLSDK